MSKSQFLWSENQWRVAGSQVDDNGGVSSSESEEDNLLGEAIS